MSKSWCGILLRKNRVMWAPKSFLWCQDHQTVGLGNTKLYTDSKFHNGQFFSNSIGCKILSQIALLWVSWDLQHAYFKNEIECISPWDHSIMDLKMSSNHSCTEQEMMREFKLGSEFFINASKNKVEACKGKQKYWALFRVSLLDM